MSEFASRSRLALAGVALLLAAAAASARTDALEPYRALARSAAGGKLIAIARAALQGAEADLSNAPDWPGPPVAVYLTLQRGRETRACVGIPAPSRGTLAETVRSLSGDLLAADRRRAPVGRDELPDLRLVLAFAEAGEPVESAYDVDPGRDGLLVTTSRGSVAFLPGEARTVRWALAEARRAGVTGGDASNASFRRFSVVTVSEKTMPRPIEEDPDAR